MHPQPHPRYSVLLCTFSLLCGCAVSNVATQATAFRLPPAKLAPDSVVLEVAQVSVPSADSQWRSNLWQELDEQALSAELRRLLADGGIRAGISGVELPQAIYDALGEESEESADQIVSPAIETLAQHRRIQLRPDGRSEIVLSDPVAKLVVFHGSEGSLSGHSVTAAQPQFALFASPRGDGSASIKLVPEIHHGSARQRFVGDNGMFRIEPGRDKISYDELSINTDLTAGQTLVVTVDGPRHSIGGSLFQAGSTDETKVLLVRLAQSQYDDLFDEPLEAPVDVP